MNLKITLAWEEDVAEEETEAKIQNRIFVKGWVAIYSSNGTEDFFVTHAQDNPITLKWNLQYFCNSY